MKIGILGTGDVGKALGKAFLTVGHDVMMASRSAGNEKAAALAKELGEKASAGTFADAAGWGDVIVVATPGVEAENAVALAGPDKLAGKIVIDATNPLEYTKGMPPALAYGGRDSGGERVQKAAPAAHVVKAFNTVGNALMFRPQLPGGPPDMFIGGN